MAPVKWTEWKDSWHLTFDEKCRMFDKHRHDAGGASGCPVHKRKATDLEPAFFHSVQQEAFDENIHGFDIEGGLDWTPGEGLNGINFIRRHKPYLGICFKPSHVDGLYKRLVGWFSSTCSQSTTSCTPPNSRSW